MALLEINKNPSPRDLRQFGLIALPIVAALVGFWIQRATHNWQIAGAVWALGALGFVLALVRPRVLRPLFVGWMIAAWPIGWVVSHLLLAAIFYLVFTPIGLLMRLVGRDPLAREFDAETESYWTEHEATSDPARYFRQF